MLETVETVSCLVKNTDSWLFEAVILAFKDALLYPCRIAGILASKEDTLLPLTCQLINVWRKIPLHTLSQELMRGKLWNQGPPDGWRNANYSQVMGTGMRHNFYIVKVTHIIISQNTNHLSHSSFTFREGKICVCMCVCLFNFFQNHSNSLIRPCAAPPSESYSHFVHWIKYQSFFKSITFLNLF